MLEKKVIQVWNDILDDELIPKFYINEKDGRFNLQYTRTI